jgi:hypothetical protein
LCPDLESSAKAGRLGFASVGVSGLAGLLPLPDSADPPLLIRTIVPWMVTPAGPMSMNPPGPLMLTQCSCLDDDLQPGFKVNLLARVHGVLLTDLLPVTADRKRAVAANLLLSTPVYFEVVVFSDGLLLRPLITMSWLPFPLRKYSLKMSPVPRGGS